MLMKYMRIFGLEFGGRKEPPPEKPPEIPGYPEHIERARKALEVSKASQNLGESLNSGIPEVQQALAKMPSSLEKFPAAHSYFGRETAVLEKMRSAIAHGGNPASARLWARDMLIVEKHLSSIKDKASESMKLSRLIERLEATRSKLVSLIETGRTEKDPNMPDFETALGSVDRVITTLLSGHETPDRLESAVGLYEGRYRSI